MAEIELVCKRCGKNNFSANGSVEAWCAVGFFLDDCGVIQVRVCRSVEMGDYSTFEAEEYECAECRLNILNLVKVDELVERHPYGVDRFGRPLNEDGEAFGPMPEIPGQTKLEIADEAEKVSSDATN